MNYYIIPAAILVALLISFLFSALSSRPLRGFFMFFLIIFLVGWSGQLWITPFGPDIWGISFLPLFFIATIVALLIISFSPPLPQAKKSGDTSEEVSVVLGIFFWMLIIVLITSIIIGYYKIPVIINKTP